MSAPNHPHDAPERGLVPSRLPVLRHVIAFCRLLKRWFGRRELTVRLLGLPPVHPISDDPGLILLQVDGLARSRFEAALNKGRMPFLASLVKRDGYRIRTMYSGQPATTPAVLGELFYGVEQAVPAYSFRDHRSGARVEMLETEIAEQIQKELEAQGEGLLKCGAAYCDIYSGGAEEQQFCPGRERWKQLHDAAMWKKAFIVFLHLPTLLKLVGAIIWELVLITWRLARRQIPIINAWAEIKFIPRHLIASVVLRDATTLAVETDAIRGIGRVHANFLGYDDVAHHAGPDSAIALRMLRDIDRSIHRIWKSAHSSRRRNYQVWILSDHGQEATVPYDKEFGGPLPRAILRIARDILPDHPELQTPPDDEEAEDAAAGKLTVAIGPLGFVYWPAPLNDAGRRELAVRLVAEAHIPIVLGTQGDVVKAWSAHGEHHFPENAAELLGKDHPHLEPAARDLAALCSHVDAGDLIICGYRTDKTPLSFVLERGAHGGPGPLETSGFVLFPPDAPSAGDETLRPKQVRELALQWLEHRRPERRRAIPPRSTLRVATYNVHGCVGLDGRLSPARIARVLASLDADVIALQELDVGRNRSGAIDQAQVIADALEMELQFGAAIDVTGERYGNAILSRWPMKLRRAALLPGDHSHREPRGALWASIDFQGETIDVLSTHLGLTQSERNQQAAELLSGDWACSPDHNAHTLLCGDLNSSPGSNVCRQLRASLRDVQAVDGQRGRATWSSAIPLRRIDHIFVGSAFRVLKTSVPRTRLTMVASDHLPLVADLELVYAVNAGVAGAGLSAAKEAPGPPRRIDANDRRPLADMERNL